MPSHLSSLDDVPNFKNLNHIVRSILCANIVTKNTQLIIYYVLYNFLLESLDNFF